MFEVAMGTLTMFKSQLRKLQFLLAFLTSAAVVQTAAAECYKSSPWRMGDATEGTFGGLLTRNGESFRLEMDRTSFTESYESFPERFFQISTDVMLPSGQHKMTLDFSPSDSNEPLVITLITGGIETRVSSGHIFTITKPQNAQVRIRRKYVGNFEATISMVRFCLDQTVNFLDGTKSSNWSDQAFAYLIKSDNRTPVSESVLTAHTTLRCIRLNNYWCLKDKGWDGRLGKDRDDHTSFVSADMGARAAVRNFRTAYSARGRKSALAILSAYSPSNDCRGSEAARRPDGTCAFGYNDSAAAARAAARGITDDINADLKLFDSSGKATERVVKFLGNLSVQETGLRASDDLIRMGMYLEER
jgi:hypothetical protein